MSSVFGNLIKVSTFGESHGSGVGVVVDGIPAGLPIDEDIIQKQLDRRRPGTSKFVSPRNEGDKVEILSGVAEGKSLGTPIAMLVRNTNQRSKDYGDLLEKFRPGHADYAYYHKYGTPPQPGGGRSSGRETLSRVAAGAIAQLILGEEVQVDSAVSVIAGHKADKIDFVYAGTNPLRWGDSSSIKNVEEIVSSAIAEGDSVGGMVILEVRNVPAGLGEPVFDKLDARIGGALFSIGGVKSVEIGSGIEASSMKGSEFNDAISPEGSTWKTNNAGGILGGISTGQNIVVRIAVKPTPSISKQQQTVNISGQECDISVNGRHDPCLCGRVAVVAESMLKLVLADSLLEMKARKI